MPSSRSSREQTTGRPARVAIGAVYVAIAVTGAVLQGGGLSGFASLLGALSGGHQIPSETYGMAWVVVSGLAITSAVGTYLMIVRRPTRRGWYASFAVMLLVVLLDLMVISHRSPLRVPSAIGHAGLTLLLLALFGWRWNAGAEQMKQAGGG